MAIDLEKEKSAAKRIAKKLIIFLCFCLFAYCFLYYILLNTHRNDIIHSKNGLAYQITRYVHVYLDEYCKENGIEYPEKNSYILYGETMGYFDKITVYAGDFFGEDADIFKIRSDKLSSETFYFAILVDDGQFSESWFSNNKLSEKDLRPYTFEEQKKQAKFSLFNGFRPQTENIIGYYKFEESDFISE